MRNLVFSVSLATLHLACSSQGTSSDTDTLPLTGGSTSASTVMPPAPLPPGGPQTPPATSASPTVAPSTPVVNPPVGSMTPNESQDPDETTSEVPTSNDVGPTTSNATMSSEPPDTCVDIPDPEQTCATRKEWGNCEQQWLIDADYCALTCGRCTPSQPGPGQQPGPANTTENMSTMPATGQNDPRLPPIEGGQSGFTTRYWDCCKPHCGWPGNTNRPMESCDQNNNSLGGNHGAASACNGGPAHMCWNAVPQSNGANIAYGFAAHNGVACGTCFQLDFTGGSHNANVDQGSQSLQGKSMIVQVTNTGGIEPGQFDLLIPGGGVGDFNACSNQWGLSDLGERYGGFFLKCQKDNNFDYDRSRQCARDWCGRAFTGKPQLLEGCTWFVDWFGFADNPAMKYKQVPCPPELTAVSGL